MATATICDRCGKVYKEQKDKRRFSVFDATLASDLRKITYCGAEMGEPIDLCEECYSKFELFMLKNNVLQTL